MPPHYLRVEGVNLAHVLEDTRQLSVIRGGGLLLRQAVMDLPNELPQLKLEKISTGASIGLFGFESDTPDDTVNAVAKHLNNIGEVYVLRPDDTVNAVAKHLREHSQYQHLTFVVDSQPESTDFQHDKEALIARNRFRQMQQITVAVSEKNTSQEIGPCALDNVRPTTGHESVATERENVSLSVSVRLKHGRKQKQQFYDKETGQTLGLNYTTDLQDLAALTKQQAETPELKQLNNKIAVLYFDGNGFSGIQARHCDTKDKQLKFDKDIQGKRKAFLIALLNKIKLDSDFSNGNALRLETLLWGGDEMIFVVPAWKGLETLNFFYEHSADWAFPGSGEKLTHAGGLVFCSAKTPIQRATQLARELADGVKSRPEGRERNLFDYMVLESIDFPTESLEHTRQRQFGEAMGKTRAPLCPFNHEMKAAADWLKNLPKGQAYTCARAALADAKDDGKRLKEQVERLAEVSQIKPDDIENSLKCLFPTTPNTGWQWLHLVDLWDYLLDGGNYAGGT